MTATLFIVVELIVFLTIGSTAVWLLTSMIRTVLGRAPFVPVQNHALDAIVAELDLDSSSILIDIGCGDAKVLVRAVQQFPCVRMIGIEYDMVPYLIAKWNTRNLPTISIIRKNFLDYDFSNATHLYTYLFPNVMDQLYDHMHDHVRPGTILVSCDFTFSKRRPVKTVDLEASGKKFMAKKLHVYEF